MSNTSKEYQQGFLPSGGMPDTIITYADGNAFVSLFLKVFNPVFPAQIIHVHSMNKNNGFWIRYSTLAICVKLF